MILFFKFVIFCASVSMLLVMGLGPVRANELQKYSVARDFTVEAPRPRGYQVSNVEDGRYVFRWIKPDSQDGSHWLQAGVYQMTDLELANFREFESSRWARSFISKDSNRILSVAELSFNSNRGIDVLHVQDMVHEGKKLGGVSFTRVFVVDKVLIVVDCICAREFLGTKPPLLSALISMREQSRADCESILSGLRVVPKMNVSKDEVSPYRGSGELMMAGGRMGVSHVMRFVEASSGGYLFRWVHDGVAGGKHEAVDGFVPDLKSLPSGTTSELLVKYGAAKSPSEANEILKNWQNEEDRMRIIVGRGWFYGFVLIFLVEFLLWLPFALLFNSFVISRFEARLCSR